MAAAQNDTSMSFDVAIAGAGPIGASAALALGGAGLKVALIEPSAQSDMLQPGYDTRPLALSFGSMRVLRTLGLWSSLEQFASPIRAIHVSERGVLARVRLRAEDYAVPALGYVVQACHLGRALGQALSALDNVRVLRGAPVTGSDKTSEAVWLRLGGNAEHIAAKVAVAADGRNSDLRSICGISVKEHDYAQVAITAVVHSGRDERGVAFERFTRSGPLALLPLLGTRMGLVWTLEPAVAHEMLRLDDEAFCARLNATFGTHLGRLTGLSDRAHYPLSMTTSERLTGERLAVIGNAANNLHPVAGQGLNLGLRDMAVLAEHLVTAARAYQDPGAAAVLARFAAARTHDQRAVRWFTDGLNRVFSNGYPLLRGARAAGMLGVASTPALKRSLALRAMGVTGPLPKLCRGVAL